MSARLTPSPVWSFRADGSVFDLARPDPAEVDLETMAGRLSRLARFNGVPDCMAFSVAQHSVQGARSILFERKDRLLAALFLLHDGHEFIFGDEVSPKTWLMDAMIPGYAATWSRVKAAWDEAIYPAFDLPPPSRWTKEQHNHVRSMDLRMAVAEATALLGPRAASQFPRMQAPRGAGAIQPWGAVKAELDFLELGRDLLGEEAVLSARLATSVQRESA